VQTVAEQRLPCLWPAVQLAHALGAMLGSGALLFRTLPPISETGSPAAPGKAHEPEMPDGARVSWALQGLLCLMAERFALQISAATVD